MRTCSLIPTRQTRSCAARSAESPHAFDHDGDDDTSVTSFGAHALPACHNSQANISNYAVRTTSREEAAWQIEEQSIPHPVLRRPVRLQMAVDAVLGSRRGNGFSEQRPEG